MVASKIFQYLHDYDKSSGVEKRIIDLYWEFVSISKI